MNNPPTDWNKWLTLIAALTLMTAIFIPFLQKKYEEWKAKISFKLYLKKYFGVLFNILTYDKFEYTQPSVSDDPVKRTISLEEYVKAFELDYEKNKSTFEFRVAFAIVLNLQDLFLIVYQIQNTIKHADVSMLYE
jgi:hypothetical protein